MERLLRADIYVFLVPSAWLAPAPELSGFPRPWLCHLFIILLPFGLLTAFGSLTFWPPGHFVVFLNGGTISICSEQSFVSCVLQGLLTALATLIQRSPRSQWQVKIGVHISRSFFLAESREREEEQCPVRKEFFMKSAPFCLLTPWLFALLLPALWLDSNPAAVCPDSYPTRPRRGKLVDQN